MEKLIFEDLVSVAQDHLSYLNYTRRNVIYSYVTYNQIFAYANNLKEKIKREGIDIGVNISSGWIADFEDRYPNLVFEKTGHKCIVLCGKIIKGTPSLIEEYRDLLYSKECLARIGLLDQNYHPKAKLLLKRYIQAIKEIFALSDGRNFDETIRNCSENERLTLKTINNYEIKIWYNNKNGPESNKNVFAGDITYAIGFNYYEENKEQGRGLGQKQGLNWMRIGENTDGPYGIQFCYPTFGSKRSDIWLPSFKDPKSLYFTDLLLAVEELEKTVLALEKLSYYQDTYESYASPSNENLTLAKTLPNRKVD